MRESTISRELFANCSVAAILSRKGKGTPWNRFVEIAVSRSLIYEHIQLTSDSAVVAHPQSLEALASYVDAIARNSYELSEPKLITAQRFRGTATASSSFITQNRSADHYAVLTLAAESIAKRNTIELHIHDCGDVAPEVRKPEIASAILDGICIAALSEHNRPMTGFCVNLVAAKWHDVDSHAGAFKRVAREAMEHIFTEAARK